MLLNLIQLIFNKKATHSNSLLTVWLVCRKKSGFKGIFQFHYTFVYQFQTEPPPQHYLFPKFYYITLFIILNIYFFQGYTEKIVLNIFGLVWIRFLFESIDFKRPAYISIISRLPVPTVMVQVNRWHSICMSIKYVTEAWARTFIFILVINVGGKTSPIVTDKPFCRTT